MLYLPGGPVWDDHVLITGYLTDLDARGVLALWLQPVGGGGPGQGYYRPLAMTILAVAGRLGIPAIHALAMGLHISSALLLQRLLRPLPAAAAGAVIFAVHPLASEVLGWASALPDALAVCLGLLGAVLLAGGRSGLLVAAVTLAGVLSKETALLILPVAALAGLVPMRRAMSAWGLAAALGIGLRILSGVDAAWSWQDRLSLVPTALLWPVSSVALPMPLTAVRDLLAAPAWVVPVGLAVLAVGGWLARKSRAGAAGMLLLIAAPALALPPTLDGYFAAERYAYPALVGVGLWVAALLPSRRWELGVGLWVALSLSLHARRAQDWRDDSALFSAATDSLPRSSYAWHLRGVAAGRAGDLAGAADALQQAVATGHPHPSDYYLALVALVRSGQPEAALAWAESGPHEDLTAAHIAWWAQAAYDAEQHQRARELLAPLRTADGWAGPEWVAGLAQSLDLGQVPR